MSFPDYFAFVPRITVRDPLAEFLGAGDGTLEYGFDDAVRLAGHACPTVAMAYALTCKGTAALYADEMPQRGALTASFSAGAGDGTTGVIASIVTLITGAATAAGFKGLGGHFRRAHLLAFDTASNGTFCLARDDHRCIELSARLERVPPHPGIGALLQRCVSGTASEDETREFRHHWQDRVRRLLVEHWDDADVWQLRPL